MSEHEHVWVKWSINTVGCQCGMCYEEPMIELTCDDVNCLAVLDPATPGYDQILESAEWF